MNLFLEFLATLSAGLFTGASLYINLVEHPARMSLGTALAATEFAPSYRRATVMLVLLAVISFLSALADWFMEAGTSWLIGAVLILAVIPFTLIAILPTNRQLLAPSLDKNSGHARQLLNRWGKLHAVCRIPILKKQNKDDRKPVKQLLKRLLLRRGMYQAASVHRSGSRSTTPAIQCLGKNG